MKIYCIKLDAVPFCPEILLIQQIVDGHFARQVSGSCSLETACQMLTGRHSSLLEPHGMGHTLWMDKCKDISKAVGRVESRPAEALPDWSWINETLPLILSKKGYKCEALNPFVLSGCFGFCKYPEFYRHRSILIERIEEHKDYIQGIQAKQNNMLYMINYGVGHDAVDTSSSFEDMKCKMQEVCKTIINILKYWDFSESNSLFWIYSDHGPWRWPVLGAYPEHRNFITWAVIRDNSNKTIEIKSKVISAKDFFSLVISKFNSYFDIIDKNRIYITEDGRYVIDAKKSTTAITCKFENDIFTYLTYHEIENKFLQKTLIYSNDTKDFLMLSKSETDLDAHLVEALIKNFSWVKA